ncbi:unnamed protein product [Paramecium pentaurelia]|uniref:Uncharacterized protein n=1 Tax=Paramecium pentaurelia TaxID=43138 RepID=A0A8S1YPM3_9CILI|nr:unnamed protein product [Paramecium pentaurelia]
MIDHSQLPIYGICLDPTCHSLRPYCNSCIQQLHSKHVASLISFEQIQSWIKSRMNSIPEIKKFIKLSQDLINILQFVNNFQEKEINQENMEKLRISQLNLLANDLTKIDHLLQFPNWSETNKQLLEIFKYCQTMKNIHYLELSKDQPENKNALEQNILVQVQPKKINVQKPLIDNFQDQNQQQQLGLEKEGLKQQEFPQELETEFWSGSRFIRTKLLINLQNNNQIQYILDGSIIRSDQIKDTSIRPEILTNLEQIQYLLWKGDFGNNNKKIGKWIATWMGNTLDSVGGQYTNDGKKNGKWKELFQNYWKEAQVYEEGDWKYNYQDKTINGGKYNQKGEKVGQWTELSENFWDKSQIIYNGEYKDGKKVGRWVIQYEGVEIGVKSLPFSANIKANDDIANSNKNGKWIELSDGFYCNSQVTYEGQYRNGKKIGRWDIWWKKDYDDKIKVQIGGGLYDEEYSFKIGKWIEQSERFWDNSQVILKGEYKNGKKIDLWTIEAFGQQVGGGLYNKENSNKIGNWIELCDGFYGAAQIIKKGQYLNGKKIGKWDICYRENENQPFIQIGGGVYDESTSVKIGNWIELSDEFFDRSQVTFNGGYKNGKKVGKWSSYLKKNYGDFQNVQIGGGSYNEQDSLKVGEWIDVKEQFIVFQQLVYKGVYRDGKKIGSWMEIEIRKNQTRGIVNYDK